MACVIKKSISGLVLILCLVSCKQKAEGESIKLLVASSLMPLANDIKRLSPQKNIEIDALSSAAIAKQIEHGAPCDAAIVADERWQDYLVTKHLVRAHVKTIATNSLVLASVHKQPLIQTADEIVSALKAAKKIIIANPDFVPLGTYTREFLEKTNAFVELKEKFIMASSARHAALLVTQHAGDLAILYQTDALADRLNIVAHIPKSSHRHIEYPFLQCVNANPQHVSTLSRLVSSHAFKDVLMHKGFGLSS